MSTIQLGQHSDYSWDNGCSSDQGEIPLQPSLCSLLAPFCWQHQCRAKSPGCFPQLFSDLVPSVLSLLPALHPGPFHTGAFGEGAASSVHRAACAPQLECGKQAVSLLAARALEGESQADGTVLSEQPAIGRACLSAWALLCVSIPCLPKLSFPIGASAPAGISPGR